MEGLQCDAERIRESGRHRCGTHIYTNQSKEIALCMKKADFEDNIWPMYRTTPYAQLMKRRNAGRDTKQRRSTQMSNARKCPMHATRQFHTCMGEVQLVETQRTTRRNLFSKASHSSKIVSPTSTNRTKNLFKIASKCVRNIYFSHMFIEARLGAFKTPI